jgi:hypothetical protein
MHALWTQCFLVLKAPRPWYSTLRTLAVTGLLVLWALKALPSKPYDEASLGRGNGARLVEQIDDLFEALGIHVTRAAIGQVLIDLTTRPLAARNALVGPFEPLFDFAGMGQRWGLFLQTGREAFRLQIEGRTHDGAWTLLYRHHQKDLLGLTPWLGFRRLRGIHNPGSKAPRAQYEGFVTWLSSKIFAEHPEYEEVRVSMERLRLGTRTEPNRTLAIEYPSVRTRAGAS